jgi:hypothetical protein
MWVSRIKLQPFWLYLVILSATFTLNSCTKEIEKQQRYELEDVSIRQFQSDKSIAKTDLEFLSVAYSDIFGQTIPANELRILSETYNSSGDKNAIINLIIRNFVNRQGAQVPTLFDMKDNPTKFINDTYKKFYVRQPTALEQKFWMDAIAQQETLTPHVIYYSFLVSNEYRFY